VTKAECDFPSSFFLRDVLMATTRPYGAQMALIDSSVESDGTPSQTVLQGFPTQNSMSSVKPPNTSPCSFCFRLNLSLIIGAHSGL
jgi:hypothetical protein